jgi:predicted PurR-regulated permease PerM
VRLREPWLTPGRLVALIAVALGAWAAVGVISALRSILVLLLVSLFLSFAMEPGVQWLARRGWSRGLATGAVFVGLVLIVLASVAAIIPLIIAQVEGLAGALPRSLDDIAAMFPDLPFIGNLSEDGEALDSVLQGSGDLQARLRDLALGAAGSVVGLGATAAGLLFQLSSVALITFYLVADGPRARRVLARPLSPERQREMLAIWELAVAKTGGYIYSRALLAIICGVATTLFLLLIQVPYPVPLGLFVGFSTVFIPVVGTYIGGALPVVVALADDPPKAIWTVLFLTAYQNVENYLIAPRVQSQTMDVHPAVAFVSVLVGGTLLGAIGALLALPATAIIQALLSTYVRRHQLIAELSEVPIPPAVPEGGRRTRGSTAVGRRTREREAGA